jgi:hydrogenase-4 component E
MSPDADPQAVALLAGLALLGAVVLVWRGPGRSPRGPLALQGAALSGLVLTAGLTERDPRVAVAAVLAFGLKAIALPVLVDRVDPSGSGPGSGSGGGSGRGPAGSLLLVAGFVVLGYVAARPLEAVVPGPAGRAVPVGMSLLLVGFLLLVSADRTRMALVGFLVLDNGIATTALLVAGGVPLVVEIGVSLDVLLVVLVLRVLAVRVALAFGGSDPGQLRELRD